MKALILALLICVAFFSRAQTNSIVTENYLRLNFTPKSGVTPGTDDVVAMDCDQITARYNVTISGVTTTGTRCPSQNQLTASCPNVNDSYQGGIVAYLFVSGDYGYVSGECHGIIVSSSDLADATWGCSGTSISGADYTAIGRGVSNTSDILAGCTTADIAADLCADYSSGVYTDWCLPTVDDIRLGLCWLGNNTSLFSGYYWASTEDNSTDARAAAPGACSSSVGVSKSETRHVRAIRYF